MGLFRKIRPVDISVALKALPSVEFIDTGGTNGWIAHPPWLTEFARSLGFVERLSYAVCRRLPPGQGIPPHIDPDDGCHRYHVPLLTHPDVVMRWPDDGVEVHLEAGWLYEVCYTKLHEVVHRAPVDRIHLHFNTVSR